MADMATLTDPTIYAFDKFRIDGGRRLFFNGGEGPIPLPSKVFETLLYLVTHNGLVIEKDELIAAIWPDTIVEENNLNKNISALRQLLGEKPAEHRFIVTVPGRGYKFVADVRRIDNETIQETLAPEARTERRPSKKSAIAVAGLIAAIAIAVLAFGFSYFNSQRPIHSIAVMPFLNESGDAELEYLSDGMTETLIDRLSHLPNLHVQARSSVFHYKGKETDIRTIGKELNVQAILKCRMVQRGDDLTLYLELVDAQSGRRLWGEQYKRKRRDLVSLHSDITRDVSNKLKIKLSGADERKLKNYTENVEAYELFLKGRFHLRKRTEPEIKKGITFMQQAIDADPSYALAYAGLGEAYRTLALAGEIKPSEVWPKAKEANQKAIEIDDTLAEGHSGLGSNLWWYDWSWTEAENEFQIALKLNPNSSMAHFGYGDFLGRMGKREEGRAQKQRALELEPGDPMFTVAAAFGAIATDPDKGMELVRVALDVDPNYYFAHMAKGAIYKRKKMYPESIAAYQQAKALAPDQTWSDAILAGIFVEAGQPNQARAILNQMLRLSKSRWVPPCNIALVYRTLGETDKAVAWLEKGYEERDPGMTFLKTGGWDKLSGDPRFAALMARMHFPD